MSTNSNTKTIGERLGIGTSLRQESAARVWLDWFQAEFHMHPDGIVRDAETYGFQTGKDAAEAIEFYRDLTVAEAAAFANAVRANLVGTRLVHRLIGPVDRQFGRFIWERFDFSVQKWAKQFQSRAKAYKVRPTDLLTEFESVFPEVIQIVFEKAAKLHIESKVRV